MKVVQLEVAESDRHALAVALVEEYLAKLKSGETVVSQLFLISEEQGPQAGLSNYRRMTTCKNNAELVLLDVAHALVLREIIGS